MILWLDKHIGLDENCAALKDEFRRLTCSFKTMNTVESFRENLSNVKNRKLFCIIQGSLSEYVVPEIEQMTAPSPEPVVYILCGSIANYAGWAQNFDCIMRGNVYDFDKELLNGLTNDLNKYVEKKITEDPLILPPHLVPPDFVPQYMKAFTDLFQQYCPSADRSQHEPNPNEDQRSIVKVQ
jgi:hypothetical protein